MELDLEYPARVAQEQFEHRVLGAGEGQHALAAPGPARGQIKSR
jgi:hypothetical protein